MPFRILIADDHSSSRAALATLLQEAGFHTEVAVDGRDALQRLQAAVFDLSLLDVRMPQLTGLEVLSQMRIFGLRVPSILMTGQPTREMEMAALEAGAIAMLRKPIPAEVLRITILRVVDEDRQKKNPPPGDPGLMA